MAGVSAKTDTGTGGGPGAMGLASVPSLEKVAAAFPQLEILGLIGSGGMGVVFKARQKNLNRLVALKVMSEALASRPTFVERFEREARVMAKLNHPNIVTLYDFGQTGGFCFLLMEYVDGVNLAQAMRAGRFTPAQALSVVPKVCEALQYAHELGVLHRDIKPANLLLDERGRVKIADFGVAKLMGDESVNLTLTESGAAVGTPAYMAPEQIEHSAEVDHRADIYSLGVVFYEMLTGELPLGQFSAPSEKLAMDSRIDGIVMRALKKERELRQQSADEVRTQVEGVVSGPALQRDARATNAVIQRRPGGTPRFVSVLVLVLALIAMVAVALGIFLPMAGYFWLSHSGPEGGGRPSPIVGFDSVTDAVAQRGMPETNTNTTSVTRPAGQPRPNASSVNPPPSGAERERILVRLEMAEKKLTEDRKRFEAGVIAALALAEAQRDVDVLRCLLVGDPIGAAAFRMRFAEAKREEVNRRASNGAASEEERRQAEAEVRLLTIDWHEAVQRAGRPAGTNAVASP
jgi:serine/threonine protein kinase